MSKQQSKRRFFGYEMEGSRKPFIFSPALARKMFELRFQNETLFKEKKQPWQEFREILLANGFPSNMTVDNVRRKWSNAFDSYKIARKFGNKWWKYYKIFHKHYGKNDITDKFESWNDEWRVNLVNAITEAKAMKIDELHFWRTVEQILRNNDLPMDCCIQDIKPLWNYLKNVFQRKHRPILNSDATIDWPPFKPILKYFKKYEKEYFLNGGLVKRLKSDYPDPNVKIETVSLDDDEENPSSEFIWTKDTTETFIQIRLQNEYLFRQTAWAWNNLRTKMINEHDFPKNVSGQDLSKKWACIMRSYQKAQATNNTAWIYHNLFESYYGDGNFTLNPLHGWDEIWIKALIAKRTEYDYIFSKNQKEPWKNWREVEMALRQKGLPISCSVIDLPFMWDHLYKTFMWKQKFTQKGILSVPWPYYDAMFRYQSMRERKQKKPANRRLATINNNTACDDDHWDDDDDDVKLFDLKQRMDLEPKIEVANVHSCRTCTREEGCVDVFDTKDDSGVNLAHKLHILCGIKIDKSDNLTRLICLTCVRDLEQAFKFRERCQQADNHHRSTITKPNSIFNNIKLEIKHDEEHANETKNNLLSQDDYLDPASDIGGDISDIEPLKEEKKIRIKREPKTIIRKVKKKYRYNYTKVCEVCGKHTTNLKNHLDSHSADKEHSCDICDKKFKYRSSLQLHRVGHDPQPKKTCEVCGKTFHILAQYRRHFVYHSNKREFACETCGKRFNTIDILKVHLRTHTDERPFSCSDCGKNFRTAGCVSRHKRIVHKSKKKLLEATSPPQ